MSTKQRAQKTRIGPRLPRTPVQERSQQTVGHILHAASRLLTTKGIREITTNNIAAEAGISIGALYRFFPDKQSIIDAIAVQHIEEFQQSALVGLMSLGTTEGPQFLAGLIDHFADFLGSRPDFRAIAFGGHISDFTRTAQSLPDAAGVSVLKQFMLRTFNIVDYDSLDLKLRVAVETGERLMAFAFQQNSAEQRAQVIGELKRILASYLF